MAVAAPSGGMLDYARASTLSIWLFTLLFPFLWVRDWYAILEMAEEGVNVKHYYFVGFAIASVAHLTLGIGAWFAAVFKLNSIWSGRFLTAFCAVQLVVSPLSLVPRVTAIYAAATWGVLLLLYLYWHNDYRITQRMIVFAGFVVFAWLFLLMFKHGITLGAAIGGINRNTSATAAVGGMICCFMSPKKSIRWTALGLALFMALIVNSRGSIVALAAFLCTYYALYNGTLRAGVYGLVGMVLICALALAWPHLRYIVFEEVLHLHQEGRGFGSGFTGRVGYWLQALTAFWDKLIFGYGFRVTTQHISNQYGGIHSGYLKIMVETGFVGFFLVVGAVIIETLRRFRIVIRLRNARPGALPGIDVIESMRLNAIVASTLCMTLTFWVYEQLYIQLGTVVSLVFLMMMVAPAYISTQGKAAWK